MDRATQRSVTRLAQSVTRYSLHLLIAVVGSMLLGAVAAFLLVMVWGAASRSADALAIRWALLHRPFPFQLVAALLLGALVARRLSSLRLARWIWVAPAVMLFIRLCSWTPYSNLTSETAWQHFFGPCLRPYCPDQFTVTLPFYVSLAYVVGYLGRTALLTTDD